MVIDDRDDMGFVKDLVDEYHPVVMHNLNETLFTIFISGTDDVQEVDVIYATDATDAVIKTGKRTEWDYS